MTSIKGVSISAVADMEMHAANGAMKEIGNETILKRLPDGRCIISPQMVKHALFNAAERANNNHNNTYFANADGTTNDIVHNITADMRGFLLLTQDEYGGKRISPVKVTPALARKESKMYVDLLTRHNNNPNTETKETIRKKKEVDPEYAENKDNKDGALVNREMSISDSMVMNAHIDVQNVGMRCLPTYDTKGWNISKTWNREIDEEERRRRVWLFVEAFGYMTDFANQSRNAFSAAPVEVIICFDPIYNHKVTKYFTCSEIEQKRLLAELDDRGAKYSFAALKVS